jgi:hypothetical protein
MVSVDFPLFYDVFSITAKARGVQAMNIFVAGLSYKTTPVELREKLAAAA